MKSQTKVVAALLSALLILLSPGAGCYRALALETAAAAPKAGLPAVSGMTPRLHALSSPASAARFDGVVRHGVDVGAALRLVGAADLASARAQASASPLFARLAAAESAAGRALTDDEIVDAVAASVATHPEMGAEIGARANSLVTGGVAAWQARRAEDVPSSAGVRGSLSRWAQRLAPASSRPAVQAESVAGARAWSAALERPAREPGLLASLLPTGLGIAAGAVAALLLTPISAPLALTVGVTAAILGHEAGHLALLRYFGDDTASKHGVRSVFDLIHPVYTLGLPAVSAWLSMLAFGNLMIVGWAKPIPVDFNRLGNTKRNAGLVSLAGPAANVVAAAALGLLALAAPAAALTLMALAKINVGLAVFNMLPLPHLDGGKALVALLPQRAYKLWIHNSKVPDDYQSVFQRLYQGPSALLNFLSISSQSKVNWLAMGVTAGLFGVLSLAAWWFLAAPLVMFMLVCSYDYYCIREKIQNENATKGLQGIISGFASALKEEIKGDKSVRSKVNTEEVEHILKNALEDTIDQVVDSEGFDDLTDDQKWERLHAAYMDAAVAELKKKGMTKDTPETIRRVLSGKAGQKYMADLRNWINGYDVWKKWHSPNRKKAKQDDQEAKPKEKGKTFGAGGTTAALALMVAGAGLLSATGVLPDGGMIASAGAAALAGTLQQTNAPAPLPKFEEGGLDDANVNLTPKQKAFLQRFLTDLRFVKKPPVIGRVDEMNEALDTVAAPRGMVGSPGTELEFAL